MHNLSYKSLFLIIVFLLIPIVFLLRLQTTPKSILASWWNDSWTYRQRVDVSGVGSTNLTNFQVSLTIGTSALISSGKMQSDCDDIRITDQGGNILPHWIEENNPGCNSVADTKIWIKISSLPTSGAPVYIYYGNPSATDVQDGSNVFEFFDDFNNGITKWGTPSCGTISNVSGSLQWNNNSGGHCYLFPNINIGISNVTVESRTRYTTGTTTTQIYWGTNARVNSTNRYISAFYHTYGNDIRTQSSLLARGGTTSFTIDTWYQNKFVAIGTSLVSYRDDSQQTATSNSGYSSGGIGFDSYASAGNGVYQYDYIFARKAISSSPSVNPQSEETGGGPIAWWKFDEGIGTTAFDTSGKNNHGIFGSGTSAPTWTDESQCITGKCLKFDGSNDYIFQTIPNNIPSGQTARTISAWVKPTNTNPGGVIVAQNGSVGTSQSFILMLGTVSSTTYLFSDGENVNNNITISGSEIPSINSWHHISFTFNGNNTWVYYLDGVQKKTGTFATPINTVTSNVEIGRRGDSPNIGSYFPGFIDDVKIYPYARTASQIKADYTSGLAGQSSSNSSANMGEQSTKGLSDGLVAYYKFDEGVGTTSTDSSGNSNLATFATGTSAPSWNSGKYGVGLSFGGNGQNASTTTQLISGTNPTFSYSLWVKAQNSGNNPQDILAQSRGGVNNNASYEVVYYTNTKNICLTDGGGGQINCHPYDLGNSWTHLSIINDYQNNSYYLYINGSLVKSGSAAGLPVQSLASQFKIGNHPYYPYAKSFSGLIDEVRIYNRALSPTEVKELYEYAPGPVGYWKFEEGVGGTAFDSSGYNRNASIVGTPQWVNGKTGKSLLLDGSTNYLAFSSTGNLYSFTLSGWIKTSSNGLMNLFSGSSAGWYPSIFSSYVQWHDGVTWRAGTTRVDNNKWHYVSYVFNQGTNYIYTNGNLEYSGTGSQTSGNIWMIGDITSGGRKFNGSIDEVKIYNYARTQSQILEDMNAGSGSKKPIVHYKFDEGQGSLVNNSGIGGTINGTFGSGSSSPTWSEGKFNKALSFDGSDILSTSSNFSSLTSEFTISTWVKPASSQIQYANIFGNHAANYTGLVCQQNSTTANQYYCAYGNGATWIISSNFNLIADSWQHLVYTKNNLGTKIYVDGLAVAGIDSTAPVSASSTNIRIGQGYASGGRHFNGLIDEFKIYNYALSPDEIKQDYNQDSTTKIGQSSQTIGATTTNLEYCIPGDTSPCASPIAEWKFEEGTGTTAIDSGSNTYNLPFGTGDSSPSYSTGKFGKSLLFTNNDYIGQATYSLGITGPITINTWVKTNSSTAGGIISRYGNSGRWTYRLYMDNTGKIIFNRGNNTTGYNTTLTSTTPINNDQWHYLSARYDGSTMKIYIDGTENISVGSTNNSEPAQGNFCIGTDYYDCHVVGTGHFNGSIDHVRIYNYARTPAQIAYDYNKGEPVAWWKLDECQGSTAYDSSGIGNTGSISIGTGGSQTSVGTCTTSGAWFNGATGKNNSSLNFDGTDDKVNTLSPSNTLNAGWHQGLVTNGSFSLWAKTSNYTSDRLQPLLSSTDGYSNNKGISFEYDSRTSSNKRIVFKISKGTSGTFRQHCYVENILSDNNWHHWAVSVTPTAVAFYRDGVSLGSATCSPGTATDTNTGDTTYPLSIGGNGQTGFVFGGQLDDVRIYNYALTSTQVKSLYNGGALNFR